MSRGTSCFVSPLQGSWRDRDVSRSSSGLQNQFQQRIRTHSPYSLQIQQVCSLARTEVLGSAMSVWAPISSEPSTPPTYSSPATRFFIFFPGERVDGGRHSAEMNNAESVLEYSLKQGRNEPGGAPTWHPLSAFTGRPAGPAGRAGSTGGPRAPLPWRESFACRRHRCIPPAASPILPRGRLDARAQARPHAPAWLRGPRPRWRARRARRAPAGCSAAPGLRRR